MHCTIADYDRKNVQKLLAQATRSNECVYHVDKKHLLQVRTLLKHMCTDHCYLLYGTNSLHLPNKTLLTWKML